ncbi:hypothetical protein K1T71_003276 [Dendrolimus kikuchii]|uniref:Uncharacterized protein n=1 Tax=Dendrolimus kikuchii TaxID=765133 RepID=A0ACC1DBK7_9NEOP|nr:hypothetical protein K1T71_003276 [Dendrolimus kikuchii]
MALKTSYELHHHFPKIAEESGFAFNNHRPRVHLNWNKIRLIDIENLIRERKFVLIEQHLNDILDCVLESEFDVRILDEGVLKLFRLAQLAVEYQQFCRQYLDRSVYILRQEITTMAQELESTKKNLEDKEEELRKLKRRTRHTYKTPLPYGNDNIANMILKTLSNRTDLFPPTSNLDTHQYNKCKYCDKVFLNQLYLKSHIERRHADVIELSQKEIDRDPNQNFNSEIIELKKKLKDMEELIASKSNKTESTSSIYNDIKTKDNNITETDKNQNKQNTPKNVKDAEVSTNNDEYLINKLEEWKKEEHEKHTKEISKLRNEILETINSFKGKEEKSPTKTNSDTYIMKQLHATIEQQGVEILSLKEELNISKIKAEKESVEKYQEAESRVAFWIQKAEAQAKQYESLLEKLNDIAKDAKESRALAEAERERATKLEAIIKQNLSQKAKENIIITEINPNRAQNSNVILKNAVKEASPETPSAAFNRDTLEKLHKRAQELLNMDSISSTSTDVSSVERFQAISPIKAQPVELQEKINNKHKVVQKDRTCINEINLKQIQSLSDHEINQQSNKKELKSKHRTGKSKIPANIEKEVKTSLLVPESPIKVIRAKLTEEVNNRLVLAGVDPLKSRLSENVFRKQRAHLQQQHELKSKKYASFDKVRNAILTYLDENTSSVRSESNQIHEYAPSRKSKTFRGFTSVIENVKTKALSLVKGNDMGVKEKRKSFSAEVSKKAMSLLKTPPGSTSASPQTKRSPNKTIPHIEIPKNATNRINQINKFSANLKGNINSNLDDSEVSSESDNNNYYNTSVVQISSKSPENLKSPAQRPASASPMKDNMIYAISNDSETHLTRSQSARELNKIYSDSRLNSALQKHNYSSNEAVHPELDTPLKKVNSEENVQNDKQTKGVLKNATSTSSLSKKKVLFDMDAIQMKSLSASPSQSITEQSHNNHKHELGFVNLDTEEWDISSIESDPLQNDTKIRFTTRTTPKIAELKKKIETQLARRNETTTALVGSVDVLGGSLTKAASIGGSNTSLGSSILDESGKEPVPNHKTVIKAKKAVAKNDSDLDMSDLSIEDLDNKNESF